MRFGEDPDDRCSDPGGWDGMNPRSKSKDVALQLILSLILGVSAFITFCILRPRWPSLYSARRRRLHSKIVLPALTDSFLGWIPRLYKITEEQVLAAAGLDAFVFLAFFKMAIRLFSIMGFFAIVVLWPINEKYRQEMPDWTDPGRKPGSVYEGYNATNHSWYSSSQYLYGGDVDDLMKGGDKDKSREKPFLWAYVIFTYFFAGLTIYMINWETFRIIRLRQDYLGTQSTITDRTFRLTGIPQRLRSEERLKDLIEKLDIGIVDTVTLCRDWKQLDALVAERDLYLRRLESAWAKYLKSQDGYSKQHSDATQTSGEAGGNDPSEYAVVDGDEEAGENGQLLPGQQQARPHISEGDRPQVTIRYGALLLRSRKVDAIDYYEEKLRRLDEQVVEARKKEYEPTDMALVTMDTVASCQMVIQARIDPRPGRLLTKPTPSPSDLVWRNTYALRGIRRLKAWAITLFITFLTLIWIFPTAFFASWRSICTINHVLPAFVKWLDGHPLVESFIQNGAPTLVVSLLNVSVPYLYDWLSNHQGIISQGDVELSVISKNFFFTFFNTFFVFAVSQTGFEFWSVMKDFLQDTSQIPRAIAQNVAELSVFYISFIILQGIGLMPFRILEVGSVVLTPFYRMQCSTPRDHAELQKPPSFQYGFYLPTALLVFNLCLIYSVLSRGYEILVFGVIYFGLGYFSFKYMLLYAMDQPQHATGGAWRIICLRILIGLLVFEVVMIGQIAASSAFFQSVTVIPLLPFTIWYSYYFKRRFEPLTKYIALRAIKNGGNDQDEGYSDEGADNAEETSSDGDDGEPPPHRRIIMRRGSTLDEYKERGLTFVNPSLFTPLVQPWIYRDPPPVPVDETGTSVGQSTPEHPTLILPNADSSLGIGENNVWIDSSGRE